MNPTKIEWCTHTWNPVTGCRRGCHYCYARRIHERFNKTSFSQVTFHEDRLGDPLPTQKPRTIFVGSMSDPEYWEESWMRKIVAKAWSCRQHNFMFLTKNWEIPAYKYLASIWLKNAMQGLTLERYDNGMIDESVLFFSAKMPRPFISLEPLRGRVNYDIPDGIELVIVGAMTGPNAEPVKPEWIQSIKDHCPEEKIFWKSNLTPF